jgi:hypothetical protein
VKNKFTLFFKIFFLLCEKLVNKLSMITSFFSGSLFTALAASFNIALLTFSASTSDSKFILFSFKFL